MKFKLLIFFALFLPTVTWQTSASAHTSLISEKPIGNSVLDSLPSQVELTFDETLIEIGNANVLTVLDPNGNEITTGNTIVTNNVVSRFLKPSNLEGQYSVTYRVVSEDGHVVSATYKFTLRNELLADKNVPETQSKPTKSLEPEISSTPIANLNVEAKEDLHADHSFWGRHAGHFYIFIASFFLLLAWKKHSK